MTSVKPRLIVPAPDDLSKLMSASEKNGGLSGRRRFEPVPSMYWVIPYPARTTSLSSNIVGVHANPSRGSKPL